MAEWAVRKLSYRTGWRGIFGGMPSLLMEADPAVQRGIISRAEKSAYGEAGLESYELESYEEEREKSALRLLARRALAQHLCQRALLGSALVNGLRRVILGIAFPPPTSCAKSPWRVLWGNVTG